MTTHSFSRIEISILEGRAQSTRLRQKLFHSLHEVLKSLEIEVKDAILADTGYSESEVTLEYSLTISELRTHYASLNLEEDLKSQRSLENLDATTDVGIVYIIPSQQNLFYSSVSALTAALAAGNCVILELPQTLTQVSGILRKILPSALDADIIAISGARPPDEFLSKCYVLTQTKEQASTIKAGNGLQSKALTEVVAVVDRTANVREAAIVVGTSCVSFNGRADYAPGLVLVNEFVIDDFVHHLVQAVASPVIHRKPSTSQQLPKSQADINAQTMKELENDDFTVLVSGSNGSIVEIKDRSKAALGCKIEGPVIIICRITSLDDAIDLCSNSFGTPLEASYVFAAATNANYLSRFIDARISCINHIPVELLVGPFAPKHPTIAPSLSPRYPLTIFRSPRPRIENLSHLGKICQDATRLRSTRALESWSKSVVGPPLPSIKQGDGKATGFFDAALIVVGCVILSVTAGATFVVFRLTRKR
ncbi:aldehyde dehydrogenase PutA [Xylogone sp. PMI_703]|nr:aldehyde dehydrogenase PutA [Xylogone sp. PMI_703]